EAVAGGADDVEVWAGGLHQQQVRALGHVEVDLAHGFAEVRTVHLVAAPVAELRGGVGGFAEGAVEGRGEFGGVGEDGGVRQVRGARFEVRGGCEGRGNCTLFVVRCTLFRARRSWLNSHVSKETWGTRFRGG